MEIRAWGLVLIILMGVYAAKVWAVEPDMRELWPTDNLYTAEQVKELFYNMRFNPFDRKDLSFTMLVVREWQGVPLKVSREQLEQEEATLLPLAEVRAPDWEKSKAAITVHSVKLARDAGLEEWVSAYLLGNGLSPVSRRRGTFNGRNVEDVLVRLRQGKDSFLARMSFSRHGPHLFMITCSALEDTFREYARVFSAAVITFQPLE